MERRPDSTTLSAFVGAMLIGGSNFIAVTFSNDELPPQVGATLRFALGSLLFLLLGKAQGVSLARGRAALGAALYGLLGFGIAYACLYYALIGLSAGTTSVVLASVPLFTLAIAAAAGQETFTVRGVAGGVLAIAGIAVLSLGSIGGEIGASYLLAAIAGTISIAASSVLARGLRHVHPVNMNAIGMIAGTAFIAAAALLLGESWALPRETDTILALGWLVTIGSVGLFQLYLFVINRWTASATVYALTGMPVVAIILGAIMLDQPITLEVVAGAALVILAVWVGAISRSTRPRRPLGSRLA